MTHPPVRDPHAATLITATLNDNNHVVLNDDGKPFLTMSRKQALHLMARLAVALAEVERDA